MAVENHVHIDQRERSVSEGKRYSAVTVNDVVIFVTAMGMSYLFDLGLPPFLYVREVFFTSFLAILGGSR